MLFWGQLWVDFLVFISIKIPSTVLNKSVYKIEKEFCALQIKAHVVVLIVTPR